MGGPSTTLYRFRIELSDVDRSVFESLDFRVALHPSETLPYLLTRVFAYALNFQEGLQFSPGGLSDPDVPAISVQGNMGRVPLWIEIGNPSVRKLHKASKASSVVKVYTYKDAELLVKEAKTADVHRAEDIEIYAFSSSALDRIATDMPKDVRMTLLANDGILNVTIGEKNEEIEIKSYRL